MYQKQILMEKLKEATRERDFTENALKSVKSSLAEIFPNGTAEKSPWLLSTQLAQVMA